MHTSRRPKEPENKRKFARIEIEIPAKFIQLDQDTDEVVFIHDVSAGGISLTTTKKLEKNSPLELQLQIPDGGKSCYVKGKVVWVKPVSTDTFRLGITAENLDLTCLSRILRLKLI
ncbi:MAG: PilZ domain-containing protein [Candidatus Omnitrophica bacterium]|nr:PilZ domain-containing protein [Candidatus Omnitrophota bacterium]